MLLKKKQFRSEEAKKLWEKHFGFLEKKPEPKRRPVYSKPKEGLFSKPESNEEKMYDDSVPGNDPKPDLDKILPEETKNLFEEIDEQFENEPEENVKVKSDTTLDTDLTSPSSIEDSLSPLNFNPIKNGLENKVDDINPEADEKKSFSQGLTLYDIVKYAQSGKKQVEEEENLIVNILLATISKHYFGVIGDSGSGKTFITEKIFDLVDESIYEMGQSSSLAIFYDSDNVNQKKIIYLSEIQKSAKKRGNGNSDPLEELMKDLAEGRNGERKVTRGKSAIRQVINEGIGFAFTLASDNGYKLSEENKRRFALFFTDSSPEHLEKIHAKKAKSRYSINNNSDDLLLKSRLRKHLNGCINMDEVNIIDPFSEYIRQFIPETQKSTGYVDHYYKMIDACVKFNYHDRVKFSVNGEDYVLSNLEDHYQVFQTYYPDFISTLKDFSTHRTCENEEDKEDMKREIEMFENLTEPDWAECFRSGLNVISNESSLEFLEKTYQKKLDGWIDNQIIDNQLYVLDIRNGNTKIIADLSKVQPSLEPEYFESNGQGDLDE